MYRTFNIFQVYQYFTTSIYRWYFILKFEQFLWISYTTLFKIRSLRRYQRPFYAGKSTWYCPLLKGLHVPVKYVFEILKRVWVWCDRISAIAFVLMGTYIYYISSCRKKYYRWNEHLSLKEEIIEFIIINYLKEQIYVYKGNTTSWYRVISLFHTKFYTQVEKEQCSNFCLNSVETIKVQRVYHYL